MKSWKKRICFLISLVMVLSTVSLTAFGQEEEMSVKAVSQYTGFWGSSMTIYPIILDASGAETVLMNLPYQVSSTDLDSYCLFRGPNYDYLDQVKVVAVENSNLVGWNCVYRGKVNCYKTAEPKYPDIPSTLVFGLDGQNTKSVNVSDNANMYVTISAKYYLPADADVNVYGPTLTGKLNYYPNSSKGIDYMNPQAEKFKFSMTIMPLKR